MPDTLHIVQWNPHRGNTAARVTDTLDAEVRKCRPQVIVLNEVRRHHDTLAGWAKRNGYSHFQEKPRPDANPMPQHGSTALLVDRRDDDLELLKTRTIPMRVSWRVFSHQQWHHPRRYERALLRTPGGRWKVTASHWPTNGFEGGNRVAFAESATRAAAALVARVPGTVTVDVGDHNESVRTLRKWARPLGAKVAGHGPDSCITVGATVVHDVGPKAGSDHHLVRYELTRK